MNYEDLTERQKRNLEEFMNVTAMCDDEQLAAIDHQIPMTRELFERCIGVLIRINAVNQINNLLLDFPDLAKEYRYEIDEALKTKRNR